MDRDQYGGTRQGRKERTGHRDIQVGQGKKKKKPEKKEKKKKRKEKEKSACQDRRVRNGDPFLSVPSLSSEPSAYDALNLHHPLPASDQRSGGRSWKERKRKEDANPPALKRGDLNCTTPCENQQNQSKPRHKRPRDKALRLEMKRGRAARRGAHKNLQRRILRGAGSTGRAQGVSNLYEVNNNILRV